MSTVRIGIVGAGNIATNAHMPAYTHCADAQVVAVADIDFQRAKDFAERFHLEAAYSSVEEMLDKSDIDAVDVCVWNCAHAEVSIAALRAGKAVLCEKPLSYDLESALQIQEEVKKAGVPFWLGFPTGFIRRIIWRGSWWKRENWGIFITPKLLISAAAARRWGGLPTAGLPVADRCWISVCIVSTRHGI